MGEPESAVPVPKIYGGDQEESEEAQLVKEKEEEGAFNIAKSKEEARTQMKVLENSEEVGVKYVNVRIGSEENSGFVFRTQCESRRIVFKSCVLIRVWS